MTEPFSIEEAILHGDDCPKYTARDMQAYAAQAVAAERERLQELNASQARMIETYLSDITRDQAEIGRLRAALADSCEEHRAEIYDTATGAAACCYTMPWPQSASGAPSCATNWNHTLRTEKAPVAVQRFAVLTTTRPAPVRSSAR